MKFELQSEYSPAGDQPEAISQLVAGIRNNVKHQTLLGVTGSGKTFTIANLIQQVQMPVLVISHNKTLAAQLYQEFKDFFPSNAVEYFVSFYDYYQPEAYIPSTDTYIEKTSDINQEIDRLRLKSTSSLLSRNDTLIVASVSCIYNIGSPYSYLEAAMRITTGQTLDRREFLGALTRMQYKRNDMFIDRGMFRVRGDVIEIQPAYDENGLRIELFGDQIETISVVQSVTGKQLSKLDAITIFPAKHFIASKVTMDQAIEKIGGELKEQLTLFNMQGKLVEAQRLDQRTRYDIEMLREVGYVNGVENYSRILDGREPGSTPHSLLHYFRKPFLTVIDESHASIPQIGGMSNGDLARKTTLVEHGFRLPCALDNRPLRFPEFEQMLDFVVYVSATPADYELQKSGGVIVEQVIRPTGLVDPPIEIRPAVNQVDDLIEQLRATVEKGSRTLVTTLTKKMAEDLSEYLESLDFKVRYLHSDIDTLERSEILRDLRLGEFDILIGINLLREGLDLPEVALVAILDADKEGFLRSARSIIQIAGRAARNVEGRIILYADTKTDSIRKAIDESERRRTKQLAHNEANGIVPKTIKRDIRDHMSPYQDTKEKMPRFGGTAEKRPRYGGKKAPPETVDKADIPLLIEFLHKEMAEAAADLEFEKAAKIRDRIAELKSSLES